MAEKPERIEINLKPGARAEAVETVNAQNTARSLGSGVLDVYATPAMTALMEKASVLATAPFLPEECSTVGTSVNIRHIAASPLGAEIRAESELAALDGRKLSFTVRAWDGNGLIGEGQHERFIIDKKKFMEKTEGKMKS
ncbi:MAG: thioesterase family protein [Spirochaetaceae bacterium]|jgi:predicted thioesterase|nr:thioesterase family protein [Spirochaetaceae bacterium]